ncbi:MAG: glycosyltransferase family 39 protein [bacterium]
MQTLLVAALALLLRIPFLSQSLWLDEAIEALALQGKMGPLLTYALADFQPPLYHGLLYVWTQLVGTSEVALRLPSLLAGVGVVVVGLKLAELLAGKRAGLIVGLLLATNPLLIYYSVEGRTYMLTTFFVTLSFYCLFRLLQNASKSLSLLYMLATIGIVWTSYLGALIVVLQGLYLLVNKKWSLILPLALGAGTIVFWLPSFVKSLGVGGTNLATSPMWASVVGQFSWKSLPLTWVKFVLGRISFDNKLIYAGVVGLVGLLHLYILKGFVPKLKVPSSKLLLLWLVGPVVLGLVITNFIPVYQFFRVLFVLPAYFMLLGLALSNRPSKITIYALVATQLIFLGVYAFSPRFHHEDWRALVATYGENATYALPSIEQNAPLLYYGVARASMLEPKVGIGTASNQIVYIRYAEEVFDAGGVGRANLLSSGYTKLSEQVFSGLATEVYAK